MIILRPYINETKRYDNTKQNDNVENINLLTDSVLYFVFLIYDKLTSFQRDHTGQAKKRLSLHERLQFFYIICTRLISFFLIYYNGTYYLVWLNINRLSMVF